MSRSINFRPLLIVCSAALMGAALTPTPAFAQAASAKRAAPDLADRVAGEYHGAVIADTRGSSRNGITLTVRKIGKDTVEITSDYARIPTTRIRIERVADAIMASGPAASQFLIETNRNPNRIDLSLDGATIRVER